MTFLQVVPPKIKVPILKSVIGTSGEAGILVETPRMNGSYHWRNGATILYIYGIAQILVIGISGGSIAVDNPPRIGAPEEAAVLGDGSIKVECRREIGELEAVVEIERRGDFGPDVKPLAERQTIADEDTRS